MATQLILREELQLYSLGDESVPTQSPTTLYTRNLIHTQPKRSKIQEFSNTFLSK
jgi:hypothetical protein